MSTNIQASVQPFSAELIFAGPETLNVRPSSGVNGPGQLSSVATTVRTPSAFAQQGR